MKGSEVSTWLKASEFSALARLAKTFCHRGDRNDDDDYNVAMKSRWASLSAPFQQGSLHKM